MYAAHKSNTHICTDGTGEFPIYPLLAELMLNVKGKAEF
jgi:hypothetical protein